MSNAGHDPADTPQLREARGNLADAVARGREAARNASQVASRMPPPRITDEDIEQIDRAARAAQAPAELRALAERVERGELTWRQIVDGHVMDDPGVQAAMRANLAQLGRAYRKFEEGYGVDEVLESELGLLRQPRRAADDENQVTVLRHSSW